MKDKCNVGPSNRHPEYQKSSSDREDGIQIISVKMQIIHTQRQTGQECQGKTLTKNRLLVWGVSIARKQDGSGIRKLNRWAVQRTTRD